MNPDNSTCDTDQLDTPDPMDDITVEDLDGTTAVNTDELEEFQLEHILKMFFSASHAAVQVSDAASHAIQMYSGSYYDKQPYHTSILTGLGWVNELLTGHPDHIWCELGVRHHVFHVLLSLLHDAGCHDSKFISLEEQLAIFLYASVTGLSTQHLGEQFQCSNETISKYVNSSLL